MRHVPPLVSVLLLAACAVAPAGGSASDAPVAARPPGPTAFAAHDEPLDRVLARSRASGRPALLLFRTAWCRYCQRLWRETLPDPRVRAAASAYTAVAYDAERGEGRRLAARYGVGAYPTLVLVDGAGRALDRWGGYNEPRVYAAILRQMGRGG